MVLDERSRHELYLRLEEVLGPKAATTLMEHLPPIGWADVATKRDLDSLEQRLDLRFGAIDLRFGALEERVARPPNRDSDAGQAVEGASAWCRITRAVVSRSAGWGINRQLRVSEGLLLRQEKEKRAAHCGPRRKVN